MKYDIVIAGGGTAGCACAYTASKLGLKTLLVEKLSYLGGTMTSALVSPAMKIDVSQNLNTDFFETLMKYMHQKGGQITYSDGNIGWFNPIMMNDVLEEMLKSAGVDIMYNSIIENIKTSNNIITHVMLKEFNTNFDKNTDTIYTNNINNIKILSEYIETKYIVDGTGDAKIFEKLNLKFLNDFEKNNYKIYQPVNLRFIMSGINMEEFSNWIMSLDTDRGVTTFCIIDGQIHLSTAYTWDKDKKWALEPVFRSGIEEGLITKEDSNYFQVFTVPGMPNSLNFNCPRIVMEVNPNCPKDLEKAKKSGMDSIYRLERFLKQKFKGFENSYVYKIADSLGVRVSNRICGKYVYTIDDLRSGKVFDNPCLVSNYPVDVHSTKDGDSILEKREVEYMLPIESLMSKDYENLFAIGRCISADFYAQAALRIIPSCFSMGEGLAKYLANND